MELGGGPGPQLHDPGPGRRAKADSPGKFARAERLTLNRAGVGIGFQWNCTFADVLGKGLDRLTDAILNRINAAVNKIERDAMLRNNQPQS